MDTLIQTIGMLLDFRKAKTRLAAPVFLRFSQVSQHPVCLDQIIQTRKTIRYFINVPHYTRNYFHRTEKIFNFSFRKICAFLPNVYTVVTTLMPKPVAPVTGYFATWNYQ